MYLVRAFVRLREAAGIHQDLAKRLAITIALVRGVESDTSRPTGDPPVLIVRRRPWADQADVSPFIENATDHFMSTIDVYGCRVTVPDSVVPLASV